MFDVSFYLLYDINLIFSVPHTVKPVLSGYSRRRLKLGFKTDYRLMRVKSIAEYLRPSLIYHLPLRLLFCLFFEWPLQTGFTVQGTKIFQYITCPAG